MIDGEDDFFGARAVPLAEQIGGLVVGQRARQIWKPKGECVFDELVLMEAEYRREGRPPVIFDDDIERRGSRAPL